MAAYSRRLSASIESAASYDRSPKIVEMDTGRPRSSRASSSLRTTDDEWYAAAQSVSSPLLPPPPPRVAVPSSRQFPDYEWCCAAEEKPRPATAQCTPRCAAQYFAPPTPAKSVCGGAGNCPGYMSSTQSSEAKSRSQSAPKQRPEQQQQQPARKRVPLSEVVLEARASLSGGVGMANNINKACGDRGAAK